MSLWDAIHATQSGYIYEDHFFDPQLTGTIDPGHPNQVIQLSTERVVEFIEKDRKMNPLCSVAERIEQREALKHCLKRLDMHFAKEYAGLSGLIKKVISIVSNSFANQGWISEGEKEHRLLAHEIEIFDKEVLVAQYLEQSMEATPVDQPLPPPPAPVEQKKEEIIEPKKEEIVEEIKSIPAIIITPPHVVHPMVSDTPKSKKLRRDLQEPLAAVSELFPDTSIETAPKQFYKTHNVYEEAERVLRMYGETVGELGRSIRQLFRTLTKGMEIESLKLVGDNHCYQLTLKKGKTGKKISFKSVVKFKIENHETHKLIKFYGDTTNLPDIKVKNGKLKAKFGLFDKINLPYDQFCKVMASLI